MPIYEFRCRDCSKISEILFRGADGQSVRCPDCGGENLEKLISASYMIRMEALAQSTTCCGRTKRLPVLQSALAVEHDEYKTRRI